MIASPNFIAHVGPRELHDAQILQVSENGTDCVVDIQVLEGGILRVSFSGVSAVHSQKATGMMLYALAEMRCTPPDRRFVFSNWDEESMDTLEVVAREVSFEFVD